MAEDRDTEARWYVVHTYSGYENKVAQNLETIVENRRLQELIHEVKVPVELVPDIKDGKDCVIFTCGIMLEHCLEAVQLLAEQGIDAALVSFHTLKPFDDELARTYAAKCGKVFTVEEHSIIGGLGDAVASAICGMGLKHFEKIGINDVFGQSGKPAALLEEYGLTGKQIADRIAKA